ncbi:MAG: LPS assembly lipoprotein LptE [Stellaceae bacterium]
MWWPKTSRWTQAALALAIAGLTAGCFQPLYGDHTVAIGGGSVTGKLAGVQIAPIDVAKGTRLARVSVQVREALMYDMTGGGASATPTHKLVIRLTAREGQVIVDINTGRPDTQNYGIDATYQLIDLKTGKPVIKGQTFSRVSYDIPNEEQRFAGARGLRDAEDRAAKTIAENIHSRLASYFVAGT